MTDLVGQLPLSVQTKNFPNRQLPYLQVHFLIDKDDTEQKQKKFHLYEKRIKFVCAIKKNPKDSSPCAVLGQICNYKLE